MPKFDFEAALKKQRLNSNKEDRLNPLRHRRPHKKYTKGDGSRLGEDFEATSTLQFSDYANVREETVVESSGEEWEQYED